MKREEFILQLLRIFYPNHKTWLVKTLVITGLGIISRPFWEPILTGLLKKYVEVDIPNTDWVGWVLLTIGLAVYVLNELMGIPREKPNAKDIQLFEEFEYFFVTNDLIRFYMEHNFLESFDRRFIEPLYKFVETWDNAAHQFIDSELENERKRLHEAANVLGGTIAKNTVPNGRGLISVKPDHLAGGPTPDWVIRDANEINSLVPQFVELHENFIRLGRTKLYG